jgi:hypothetical protein
MNNVLFTRGFFGRPDYTSICRVEWVDRKEVTGTVSHRGSVSIPFVVLHNGVEFVAAGRRFAFKDWTKA